MLPKINHVFRLTREPELRISQTGVSICKVGLAASEKYSDKETQLFIDGTAFKKTAEMLNTVQKGQRVFVSGKLQTDSWVDQSGQKQSRTTMIIEQFEFIEKRDAAPQAQQSYQEPQSSGQAYNQPRNIQEQPQGGGEYIDNVGIRRQGAIPEIDIDSPEIPF